jgi:short-subunit dehydrogenase
MTIIRPVTLITGASKGLGAELARRLALRGHSLILTARGADALQQIATELAHQTEIVAIPGDVTDPAHVERVLTAGRARFGQIDILINNASTIGPSPMPPLAGYPLDALAAVFSTNVLAPLRLIQATLPDMLSSGGGTIVNISSDAAVQAYPSWGGYGASKAALEHLSRVLAVELEGTGIRVYVVDPGDMDTEMHRAVEPGVDLSGLPGPGPAAEAIVRLLEDERAPFGRFVAHTLQNIAAAVSGGR